jgi:hypothetical protein
MKSAKFLKNKAAPAATVNRCWSWEHWRPVDSIQFGEEPLKGTRYDELKKQLGHSGKMPQLHCIPCPKVMAWNPSTKRKRHLLFHCNGFSKCHSAKDVRVIADKEELMEMRRKPLMEIQKQEPHLNVRPDPLVSYVIKKLRAQMNYKTTNILLA